ncbi:methyl-accepting chemotaxis protein [Beijerinckia sp. L45]|uniref:methyl-accepting chemotaxis protein n=1 Tax=Beijerinckia sp. L45 TaxID=1641855 RepID=UPI00131B587F|nr:methyl-accepting chemotaxis protein [Beijerinckia sp. L45]
MLRTVNSKLTAGFAAVMITGAAPATVDLVSHFASQTADAQLGLKLGCLIGAIAVGVLAAVLTSRRITRPLTGLTADLKALADEAKALDIIATAQRKLDSNIDLMRTLLYGRGDPRRVGESLYFGDLLVNGGNDVVDQVQATHGGSATIFLGDVRISTNIKDKNGNRSIGTRLAPGPAHDAVLKEGRSYRGEAEIFGETYITIYEPIVVEESIVGILFVAVNKADAVIGAADAQAAGPLDDLRQLSASLATLRAVTAHKEQVTRTAMDERDVMADARRKAKALERAAATMQRNVVDALSMAMEKLAGADLTHRIDMAFPSEYQKLKDDFGGALSALRDTMRAIMGETQSMRGHSVEIAQAVDELSRRTEQQAASLEETAAALDLITATVKRTAEGVDDARKVVGTTKADAEHSSAVVGQAVDAMAAIEESSKQISRIIVVIDDIAMQTNLLALNAGVEAARAGDAGRGFAVVASEVRALAQRSAEAAKEIKSLISASTQQVTQGVALVGETGRSLERIVAQVAEVNAIVAIIAASAQEQAVSLQEVNTAVNQMDQVTQQNAAMVEESTAASHHLAQEAGKLEELVSQFQTGTADIVPLPRSAGRFEGSNAKSAPRPALRSVASGGAAARKPEPDKDWEEF